MDNKPNRNELSSYPGANANGSQNQSSINQPKSQTKLIKPQKNKTHQKKKFNWWFGFAVAFFPFFILIYLITKSTKGKRN